MKSRYLAAAVIALFGVVGCVEKNSELGGSLITVNNTYDIFTSEFPIDEVEMKMADSLSGFSSTRITVGALRDEDFGLTTRASVITLVPLHDEMDFGKNPKVNYFHFSAACDTISVCDDSQTRILQNVRVYECSRNIDYGKDFDCNGDFPHSAKMIAKGAPMLNGSDSLSFNFTTEYASKYLTITEEDLSDFDTYCKKFPGLYITTDVPVSNGGRINMFDLQLGYDSDYYYVTGNYAKLSFSAEYDGAVKDTSFLFYFSATDFYDLDSLITNSGTGSFPQYCLNVTGHETRAREGKATDRIFVEGGGGLKPRISASVLKRLACEEISRHGDPKKAIINKASLIFPFETLDYTEYRKLPDMLSPTCRLKNDTTAAFMGLTDASSEDEDQGDINYSLQQYSPDITYHMQEILKMSDEKVATGNYDIWLLVMAYETKTTTTAGSSELSDYYTALAYQSYYNNMYGGYGSYGYGGYGGYGSYGYGDYYSNYYSYQMAAQYAAQSSTSTSTELALDRDRFYRAVLCGPQSTTGRVPIMELTYSLPRN